MFLHFYIFVGEIKWLNTDRMDNWISSYETTLRTLFIPSSELPIRKTCLISCIRRESESTGPIMSIILFSMSVYRGQDSFCLTRWSHILLLLYQEHHDPDGGENYRCLVTAVLGGFISNRSPLFGSGASCVENYLVTLCSGPVVG